MVDLRPELDEGYRIELFAEQGLVDERAVNELWAREGVLRPERAQSRIHEVLFVATDGGGSLAGISTAYLEHNEQLRMDLWYYRAFVAKAHRRSNVAVWLALLGRDHLEQRYVDGLDRRAAGAIYEVENEGLKRHFNDALWFPTDFMFIGESKLAAHVRVRYFPGALAPEPPR